MTADKDIGRRLNEDGRKIVKSTPAKLSHMVIFALPLLKYCFKPHEYACAGYSDFSWRQPQLHAKTLALMTKLERNSTGHV